LKGVVLTPDDGSESLWFCFDREGQLRSLLGQVLILDGTLKPEESWAFTKTQFSSPERHVWIVGLLRYVQKHYVSNLEVRDEGGYGTPATSPNSAGAWISSTDDRRHDDPLCPRPDSPPWPASRTRTSSPPSKNSPKICISPLPTRIRPTNRIGGRAGWLNRRAVSLFLFPPRRMLRP
jgi:hypothetical protein